MAVNQDKRAVGIFPNFKALTEALKVLQANDFLLDKVSVITKHADRQVQLNRVLGSDVIANQADLGAKKGAFVEGTLEILAGLLVSIGALSIPTIGSGMLAGATANTLLTTLSSDAISTAADGMMDELIDLGIPEKQANLYHERVERGEYLLVIEATEPEIYRIETLLKRLNIQHWAIYPVPIDKSARSLLSSRF